MADTPLQISGGVRYGGHSTTNIGGRIRYGGHSATNMGGGG